MVLKVVKGSNMAALDITVYISFDVHNLPLHYNIHKGQLGQPQLGCISTGKDVRWTRCSTPSRCASTVSMVEKLNA
jgi:hypothetical protein